MSLQTYLRLYLGFDYCKFGIVVGDEKMNPVENHDLDTHL